MGDRAGKKSGVGPPERGDAETGLASGSNPLSEEILDGKKKLFVKTRKKDRRGRQQESKAELSGQNSTGRKKREKGLGWYPVGEKTESWGGGRGDKRTFRRGDVGHLGQNARGCGILT